MNLVDKQAKSINQLPKLESCISKFTELFPPPSASSNSEEIGLAIKKVVVKLDAPHLQPSGILERLEENPMALWGLFTLCGNLEVGGGEENNGKTE